MVDIMFEGAVETDLAERQPFGNLSATISSWLPLTVWFSTTIIPQHWNSTCDDRHSFAETTACNPGPIPGPIAEYANGS